MTEQTTNGPVPQAAIDAALQEHGAELSAHMARHQTAETPAAEITAAELVKRMALIEEAKRTAMTDDVDYGRVPGTDKPGLFKPGAEKLAVLFKLDVQPRNEVIWGPGEHLTVISRATVYHAPTGTRLGYGEGICSSRERSRAYRKQERTCPECEQPAVIKGKAEFGGGWLCWRKRGGCGAKFPAGDERIEAQEVGEIENPDLPDTWNAVAKMGKKRAYVDAVLSVTGASAIFTQDIGADPSDTTTPAGPEHGPVVAGELKQEATQAAIKLCGGDIEQAKALWAKLQADLEGYMPEAAARALLLAAQTAAPASGQAEHQNAGQSAAPARTSPASETVAPTEPPQSSSSPPAANSYGTRLQGLAAARGVEDAELANLMRNAVAQGPIPAERARQALPIMLERVNEEIADRTVELLDMFYPPAPGQAENRPGRPETSTSVDFGALEPPQAA